MTARLVFESTLIELSKVQAPALKLYEFNYLFNKAINQYINKVYNVYDINQQTTDDLRVLKSTVYVRPAKFQYGQSAVSSGSASLSVKTSGDPTASGKNSAGDFKTNAIKSASSYLSSAHSQIASLHGATYEAQLPADYLHLLNCVCVYYVAKQKDCYDAGSYIQIPATRLTADAWSQILTDIYNRPSPMKPYYYIHNQSGVVSDTTGQGLPTDAGGTDPNWAKDNTEKVPIVAYKYTPLKESELSTYALTGISKITEDVYINISDTTKDTSNSYSYTPVKRVTLSTGQSATYSQVATVYVTKSLDYQVTSFDDNNGSNFSRTFSYNGQPKSLVEKPIASRASNVSPARIEVRYGKDDTLFQLVELQIDYVKSPQFIRLTQEQMDLTEDTSQMMEFPDYVNQEIINELVHLVMERTNDPRLSNNISIDQSIARPGQGGGGQQQALAQAQG